MSSAYEASWSYLSHFLQRLLDAVRRNLLLLREGRFVQRFQSRTEIDAISDRYSRAFQAMPAG